MRLFLCASIFLAPFAFGCSSNDGTEEFYERHPEYQQRPSYFEKTPDYDDQDLNERYSGDRN